MLANNETGAVQPVAEAAEIVHSAGGLCMSMRSRRSEKYHLISM